MVAVAKLCAAHDLPHMVNNAYGVQSSQICKTITSAWRKGGAVTLRLTKMRRVLIDKDETRTDFISKRFFITGGNVCMISLDSETMLLYASQFRMQFELLHACSIYYLQEFFFHAPVV